MIYWGELEFSDAGVIQGPTASAPFDPDLEATLRAEFAPFCKTWDIDLPNRHFSTSLTQPSRYSPGERTVTISIDFALYHAQRATQTPSAITLVIAARAALFHELTHVVQHIVMGIDWMKENAMLCEVHADVFSGYWLAKDMTPELFALIGPLAFIKGGPVESEVYPLGCVREAAYRIGNGIGATMLHSFGDLHALGGSRQQLFTDTLSSAKHVLEEHPWPCFQYHQNFTQTKPILCETCPEAKEVELAIHMQMERLKKIKKPPVKRF